MQDPILLAEAVKENYALHFFGEYKAKFDTLLGRFQPLTPGIPKLDEFLKMRGPFVQALSIPRWSDTTWLDFAARVRGAFAPAGLHPAIMDGLADAGIQRLHTFQELAVARIADDKDTLVVAGTGRGKSESWLIPIFQFVVQEKLAGRVKGTKAVLIYPTKALAQDQFRRIIGYLLHINKRLSGTPITVGIYDGDTPYQSDRNLEPFLAKSFRFMDCPKKGSKNLCDVCINTAVQVENQNGHVRLTVAERECQSEVNLDFIHLTREDVLRAEVDILITNPDTINFQLINVNNPATRKVFVEQPRFIVLDEVHIYNGLFGAFVAMLMRRLRQVRRSLGVNQPLRFVAASATVQNKEEIFERLCDVHDPAAVIAEQNAVLPTVLPTGLPALLTSMELDEDHLLKVWQGQSDALYEEVLRDLGLARPGAASLLPARVTLGEQLLDKLTRQSEPRLAFMLEIYRHMRAEPQSPRQILEGLEARWGISRQAAEHLLANFTLLGGLAGILERRAHLFAWALDGYYGCAACGKVYATPVGKCDCCDNRFVSRLAFCTHCGEEVLEVWACPKCLHVYPMVASRDGESLFFDPPLCSCGGHGQGTVTTRALIHPNRECHHCGRLSSSSHAIVCPSCDAWTAPQRERMECTNPDCSWNGPLPTSECPSCGGTPGALHGYNGQRCQRCGTLTPDGSCCGQAGMPALSVPWICGHCGAEHHTPNPPALCTCGESKFYWGALLDPTRVIRSGSREWLPGRTAQPGTPSEVPNDSYKLMTPAGLLVNVTDGGRPLMPCQHPYTRWNKKRFVHMIRTPENILATSSQIQLRTHLRNSGLPLEERLKQAKMLTFSDSHRDMENVNRNFNEPERNHFLAATAYTVLQRRSRISLTELLAETMAEIERFGVVVHGAKHASNIYRDLVPGRRAMSVRQRQVRDDIASLVRQLDHRTPPTLVSDGVAGLELDETVMNTLSAEARTVLARFYEELMGRRANRVYGDKEWTPTQVSVLRSLETRGVLVREDERLYLSPDALVVSLIGPEHPGLWAPQSNTFHPEIAVQLGCRQARGLVRYGVPLEERSNPESRFFSLAVYELTYSPPALLASRVYKGDTDKEERRETEHVFKNKPSLNHISSGPAMEVGIDIGALNALALYGTPPNTNGYLQRVGRAGRRSKRSLIMTVSKSNPIDFYYYRWPLKLISAEPQPVPLTDQNREVLRISLTWAVLDYIAAHYWVPWVSTEVAAGGEVWKLVKANGMPTSVFAPPAADYHRFSRLLFTEVDRLSNGDSLNALGHLVSADQTEIRCWLAELLHGIVTDSADKEALISGVLSEFADNVYGFVKEILAEFNKRVRVLEKERLALIEQLEDDPTLNDVDRMRLEIRRTQIQSEVSQLEALREEMKQAKLMELQQISRRKRYAYSLRSVSSFVEVHRRGPASEEEEGAIVTQALPARDLAMGLTEYHPAAMVLREEVRHVVTHLYPDQFETTKLHDKLGKLRSVCANCGTLMNDGIAVCTNCGSNEVHVAHLVVPGRVIIAPATQKLHENPAQQMPVFTAQMLYRTADDQDKIQKTFAITQEEGALVDGAPQVTVCLTDSGLVKGSAPTDAVVQAVFTFAPMEMVTYVPAYSAQFVGGRREQVSLFRMCGVEHCGGVVRMGAQSFCTHDPTHDLSRARYIVPVRQFATRGIKVEVLTGDREQARRVAHSLAHGLRMALQRLAGVDLRTLGEVADDNTYLVYEDVEGGYGISDLLLRQDDQGCLFNMKQALELIRDQASGMACQCEDGCPFCLYQYGCSHRNRPGSLTRRGLYQLLDRPL